MVFFKTGIAREHSRIRCQLHRDVSKRNGSKYSCEGYMQEDLGTHF